MSPVVLALISVALSAPESAPPRPPPSDAECTTLPTPRAPFAFGPGETLEYDLDALGAQAGKLTLKVMPTRGGNIPVEVFAQTNTFFSKVRRVTGQATSFLSPKTLRPTRYIEDATENEMRRTADVTFSPRNKTVKAAYTIGGTPGSREFQYANDGLDVAGAMYLMRQLPLKKDMSLCFDAYGIRRLWRVSGKVIEREKVSLPLGEFDAWHIAGEAVRLDDHRQRRELHIWISDDARRLPLVAVGAIDLGAVRATLTGFSAKGTGRVKAQGTESMKW